MKRRGFTYIEVMIAIAVFLIMAVCVMKLNIEANKNINKQIDKQDMMMEAQKQLEIFKTTKEDIKKDVDNYHVIVQSSNDPNLLTVTVTVRKNLKNDDNDNDDDNEVILISHFYKN